MKKLSLLLVSVALFSFVSLNSCKQAPKPEESAVEEAMEEAQEAVEAAADTVEAFVEESAE
ncbi:MAG TPA: hypothetical protein VJ346_01700 [Bacteroidales bacterium]|nr:hypothetical protein [Bacteroidales bacterium]